jgi:hypothetical protein
MYFIDSQLTWSVAWERVRHVELDAFKPGTVHSMIAGWNANLMLRQIKSAIAVSYADMVGVESLVRFNVHGAKTVFGDQDKATEVLGHIQRFRSRFLDAAQRPVEAPEQDVATLLEKLAALRAKGILTDLEFQKKKADLLSRL